METDRNAKAPYAIRAILEQIDTARDIARIEYERKEFDEYSVGCLAGALLSLCDAVEALVKHEFKD